jgi:hypothetical protein
MRSKYKRGLHKILDNFYFLRVAKMNLKSVLNLFYFVFRFYCYVKCKGKVWR